MNQYRKNIISIASRRTVYATELARLLGVENIPKLRRYLAKLRKEGALHLTDKGAARYWGSTENGYRAA